MVEQVVTFRLESRAGEDSLAPELPALLTCAVPAAAVAANTGQQNSFGEKKKPEQNPYSFTD